MKILNLTQHRATGPQIEDGVVDPDYPAFQEVKSLLNFDTAPDWFEIFTRANKLAAICKSLGYSKAMIGGAPYLMTYLEASLRELHIKPVYAFSQRVSAEKEVDGKVVKVNEFKHLGWVGA